MWEIEILRGYNWPRYLIKNTRTGGYLSDNAGGALHFMDREIAESIAETMNNADMR